jgi:hypothetical protein
MSMVRKQLYIDESLNDGLRHIAERTGRSEAEHVREALRQYLGSADDDGGDGSDAILELIGLVDDPHGPRDMSIRHDDYLYGGSATSERSA